MRGALVALIKLAMDAGFSDEDIAKELQRLINVLRNGKFFLELV